jgi:hypothetical protein
VCKHKKKKMIPIFGIFRWGASYSDIGSIKPSPVEQIFLVICKDCGKTLLFTVNLCVHCLGIGREYIETEWNKNWGLPQREKNELTWIFRFSWDANRDCSHCGGTGLPLGDQKNWSLN